MIAVILYWFFLFFVSAVIGNAAVSRLGINKAHVAVVPFVGILCTTLLASMYAVFAGLSLYFELSLLILVGVIFSLTRKDFQNYLKRLQEIWKGMNQFLQALFVIIFFLAAFKSAGLPFILDNETYYVATIKWLDHYGFVPGLANLHLFLAQHSGWHIAQSSLNLDFLYPHFNDLNGFCLVLVTLYALDQLHQYFESKKISSLIIGLFPVFYVLLFQFLSSPSPDLPIYVLSVLIVGAFFDHVEEDGASTIPLMLLLAVFASFIKVTAALLLVFPLAAWLFYKKSAKGKKWLVLGTGLLAAVLFGLKNYIISGYVLYPLSFSAVKGLDWLLPPDLLSYIVDSTKAFGFYLATEDYLSKNTLELFLSWIGMSGLHGYFNKYWILLLAVFPVLLFFRKEKKTLWLLYAVSMLQFLLLWLSSPQYRFYLGFLILLSAVIMAWVVHQRMWMIRLSLVISVVLIFVTTFFNLNIAALTDNEAHSTLDTFTLNHMIEPQGNSKYVEATFTENDLDDTPMYSPEGIDFFWAVGDCPLPCIQVDQYNYFRYHFKRVPAMRTDQLKDGFYSKKVPDQNFDLEE
ncbi:LIC_10190 family membrane protein [Lutimonas sp.]|uniref:LIC_10190 family membrane protein n=1 Tax=Lutimonas sp. TaxID=1872403 RepID=UPI003D9AE53D